MAIAQIDSVSPGTDDDAGSVGEHPPRATTGANPSDRIVPAAVARRFLQIGDKYFFPDRTLAFIDTGTQLKVRTHNLEVVHSIVAIMQARGWQTVQLTGTPEFRQKVWHEAILQGIGVQGYEPSPLEMQQLQRALDRDQSMQQARGSSGNALASNSNAGSAFNTSDQARTSAGGLRPPMLGVLLAHAAAPYQFDPMQRMSYYVRVRTEVGERTVWGTDLERALAESRSGAQIGDEVILTQRGGRPVTVRVADRNAAGELVGDKKLVAQRMAWSVEQLQYVRSLERRAKILRGGDLNASAIVMQYPDMTGAVVGIKLAEQFAQRLTSRPADQARVVDAIRARLAKAIAQGRQIKLPARQGHTHAQSQFHRRGRSAPSLEEPDPSRS